jgi:hypothetical protein
MGKEALALGTTSFGTLNKKVSGGVLVFKDFDGKKRLTGGVRVMEGSYAVFGLAKLNQEPSETEMVFQDFSRDSRRSNRIFAIRFKKL